MQKRRALRPTPTAGASGPLGCRWGRIGQRRSRPVGSSGLVTTHRWGFLAMPLWLWIAAAGGCREQPKGGQSPSALCDRACSAASCGQQSVSGECNRSCLLEGARAAAASCDGERRRLLACIAGAQASCAVPCQGADCLGSKRVPACAPEREKLRACTAPCAHEGLSHHLTRQLGDTAQAAKLEVVRSGCGKCKRAPPSGARAGAPCTAASVCDRHCCQCRGGNARHTVRACVSGRCASAERACALAQRELKGLCSGGL